MLRLLVCGGRTFTDRDAAFAAIDRIHAQCGVAVLIHGAARGADTFGGEWAAAHGVPMLAFHADWESLGRKAGPIRNQRMLDEGRPDLVLALPGGRGTADMVRRATEAAVKVIRLEEVAAGATLWTGVAD
ncbi:DUF2493 domain-containing protein [Roseomonas sp. HJA6]|uniref:DUF2493 domain-containing protein n=1 Tax=Roseomonas alba TaxID=2846776 RepID=A0ABS7A3Z9_9PROT|nr:DUF2493 domain-containing protein [Neoroseomonas alba]MBW6397027.1 DUF2493 domain-containing protein [Neoroseomonas alba]